MGGEKGGGGSQKSTKKCQVLFKWAISAFDGLNHT